MQKHTRPSDARAQRLTLASPHASILASSCAAFAALCLLPGACLGAAAQDGAPAKQPPPAQSDDILKGPSVSERDLKDAERFAGRERSGKPAQSKPAMELRVLGAAIDGMTLSGETKTKVNEARAAYVARVEAYEQEARAAKKKFAEERAKAPASQPPSDEFKKRAEALEARRPKLAELKAELEKFLSPTEIEDLKARFADGLQKARAEMTRREEAERKKKREELDKAKQDGERKTPAKPSKGAPMTDEPMKDAPTKDAPTKDEPMQDEPMQEEEPMREDAPGQGDASPGSGKPKERDGSSR